jgi:hypothetical protein
MPAFSHSETLGSEYLANSDDRSSSANLHVYASCRPGVVVLQLDIQHTESLR